MTNKVLITGGAKGLGRSIACEFASHGYDVTITYNEREAKARELKRYLDDNFAGDHSIMKLNLKDEQSCRELAHRFDSLDVLINNAATNEDKNYDEFTADDFLDTYRVNLIGPYLLSMAFRELLDASRGSIVNIASTNGIDSMYKESIPYDASKSALINLTKNLSVALAPNIRVNAVAPGWIATESTEDMEPTFRHSVENKNLFNRFASPEEIAKTVYFAASEDASFMTGSIIRIDGGNRYGNR